MQAAVPKVLLSVNVCVGEERPEKTILQRSVGAFACDPLCSTIVVCVPEQWRERFEDELSEFSCVHVVNGGATRQESVKNGIEYIATSLHLSDDTCVLVHDAARCCVTSKVVTRVVSGVREHGAASAAVRVVDSLCRAQSPVIERYVDRENLWAIQTPQGFLLKDLLSAHRAASQEGLTALDDAALVARIRPIHLVEGDRFNIKVTEPADLPAATRILGG
jgi:2-C-methyl-D-erythritol 4-phosphate cytidylyltransferase/2-C-methyl-D-erythritol 2,4-cyclodiphosphate synthase